MRRVYYNGKLVMMIDEAMLKSDDEWKSIETGVLAKWSDRAYNEFILPKVKEYEKEIWNGNENLFSIGENIEKEIEESREYSGLEVIPHWKEERKIFKKMMLDKVSKDEYEKYVELSNICCEYECKLEEHFFDRDIVEYAWIERGDSKKRYTLEYL